MWFRRDLRLADHPALLAAADARHGGGRVVPLFVLDPRAVGAGRRRPRRAWLLRSLRALDARAATARLVVRHGDPAEVVPALAAEVGADAGARHARTPGRTAAAATPRSRRRSSRAGRRLVRDRLAVRRRARARVTQPGGDAVQGLHAVLPGLGRARLAGPAPSAAARRCAGRADVDTEDLPPEPDAAELALDAARGRRGRRAARAGRRSWTAALGDYDETRDRPDLPARRRCRRTSSAARSTRARCWPTSPAPRHGARADSYRSELAWREFYADVLWHRPESAREYLRPEFDRHAVRRARRRGSTRGGRGAPATRSSTPGCASCAPRAGCTTGSG